ncbi:MAG: ribosome small subunit-dependent GTPase A, partial [Nakamurella sp.]
TPGVRSFGLAHISVDDVLAAFDDLLPAREECPPGCTHHAPGIGCALDDLVAAGGATQGRLESFRRLLTSRSGLADTAD